MAINLNAEPYNDDFSDDKNFYQILFKPSLALQARELTQLQTILRDQVKKFGNHVFKHGSVVIPGNCLSDLAVPFVKVNSQYNSASINITNFENKIVIGETTGVKAVVKKAVAATLTEPVVFYLSYISGNSTTGAITFQEGEDIYLDESNSVRATIVSANATGVGSLAFINRGVYYINGTFVSVQDQIAVMSKFTSVPSCHVLLKITEYIVDSVEDNSLLDNAQNSYNYAAPGADRLKISLELTTLPLGANLTEDYVELMRYNNGVLEEHARYSKYSELEKSLARRTYDESGNYVVNGFIPTIKEHLKEFNNNGVYPTPTGDISKMIIDVSPGKAYINGFEVDKISNTRFVVDKARTAGHIKSTVINLRPEFGQYIIVSNINGGTNGFTKGEVTLYNDNDPANGSAATLGVATVIGIDYLDAGEEQPSLYKLWLTNVSIGTNSLESVGGIRDGNGTNCYVLNEYTVPVGSGTYTAGEVISHSSGRTATVKYYNPLTSKLYAYKHDNTKDAPKVGDTIVGASSSTSGTIVSRKVIISAGQSGMIFKLPKSIPASIKDPVTNSYNLTYTVQQQLVMNIVGGSGSVSISSGTLAPIELGTFSAIGPSGVIANSVFSISGNSIVATNSPQNGKVIIYANVVKENSFPKTKTLQTYTETITTTSNNITLSKTDVISLTSVVNNGNDITNNYTLFNGQTDYEYGYGKLMLKAGKSKHSGSSVTVTYTYYSHSGAGDFFCVDSYASVSNFLDNINIYKSTTNGVSYDLAACLDFRPSVNATSYDLLVSETAFNSTLQFYVPRIDSLVLDSAGKLNIVSGIPNEIPSPPAIATGQFELNRFYVPEYTRSVASVSSVRLDVERFTMRDIKEIVKRIERIEEFATLSSTEALTMQMNIVDAETGLDRYKTGFVVETFKTPLTIANTTSLDFKSTFIGGVLQATQEKTNCPLRLLETSTNYVTKNGYIMLPYTEEVFAAQPLSSRVTNLNPFLMVKWDGVLDVNPPIDTWIEMEDLPTVYASTTETVNVVKYIDPPPCPKYNIVPNYTTISEGQTITFTVTTQHTTESTLYWTIKQDVATNDFSDAALSGSVSIVNGVGTFTKTIVEDSITEGVEKFIVQLRTGSATGKIVAVTQEISILDSSVYVAPTPPAPVKYEAPVAAPTGGGIGGNFGGGGGDTPLTQTYSLAKDSVTGEYMWVSNSVLNDANRQAYTAGQPARLVNTTLSVQSTEPPKIDPQTGKSYSASNQSYLDIVGSVTGQYVNDRIDRMQAAYNFDYQRATKGEDITGRGDFNTKPSLVIDIKQIISKY